MTNIATEFNIAPQDGLVRKWKQEFLFPKKTRINLPIILEYNMKGSVKKFKSCFLSLKTSKNRTNLITVIFINIS